MKMYHATSPANARDILTNGLEVDAAGEAGYTQVYAQWADQLYGMRPIFLSTEKGKFAGIPMLVDVSGIPLVADLAAIADLGDEPPSMEDGELIWWDGVGPKELSSISSDGAVDIESMLIPGSMEAQLAISVTGTAAVLEDIPPDRIKIATYNESLLREYVRRLLVEQTFQSHTFEPERGDVVINVNPECKHKGSLGTVVGIGSLDADAGKTISYECMNDGPTWDIGEILKKTMDQLAPWEEGAHD
jgi:hypothetical protein